MDAGAIDEDPEHDAEQQVGPELQHAAPVEGEEKPEDRDGADEVGDRNAGRIEQGDDDDGAEVVDDRQRREEDFERGRDATAEQRDHAKGKGDVRRGRDCPAADGLGVLIVESHVDEGRDRHPAGGCDAGQDPPRPGRQLPVDHLALDLEPDEQKEQRHERVVDPVLDAQRSEPGVQRALVGAEQGRVGDDQAPAPPRP